MQLKAVDVIMPRCDANSSTHRLIELLRNDGVPVSNGDVVAIVESSKSVFEVQAAADGIIVWARGLVIGASYEPGTVIGRIGNASVASSIRPVIEAGYAAEGMEITLMSKAAAKKITEYGLSADDFAGYTRVRAADVEAVFRQKQEDGHGGSERGRS